MLLIGSIEISQYSALGIALALLMLVMLVSIKIASTLTLKKLKPELDALNDLLKLLKTSSLGMGQKILILEKELVRLDKDQSELKNSDLDFSYTQANKLISQGVDDRAVAANSGLSASEVHLMRLLYSQQNASKTFA